jgi:hypothetical protein
MNRRNFLKLASAALAYRIVPVKAAPLVRPLSVDALDLRNWGRVEIGRAPFWYEPAGVSLSGLPYWLVMPPWIADTYGGISRVPLTTRISDGGIERGGKP